VWLGLRGANGTVPSRTLRQAQGPLRWWRSVTPEIDQASLIPLAEPVEANGTVPPRTLRQAQGAVRPVWCQREGSLADRSTSSGSAQVVTLRYPGIGRVSLIPLAEPVEANGIVPLRTFRQAQGTARLARRQRDGSSAPLDKLRGRLVPCSAIFISRLPATKSPSRGTCVIVGGDDFGNRCILIVHQLIRPLCQRAKRAYVAYSLICRRFYPDADDQATLYPP